MLGNFLLRPRSGGSPEDFATPADKQWGSNMFAEYEDKLSVARAAIAGPMDMISIAMGISWFHTRATISWGEKNAVYCRITTRSPPKTGQWWGIPLSKDLRRKYDRDPFFAPP